jgi:Spy/CpxP family protein refolding chaperone
LPRAIGPKLPLTVCLFACLHVLSTAVAAAPATPYAGPEARDIKALSPEDVDAYLAGKGMGLAKAAELNGLPGPSHVLELSAQLALTPEQRVRTEALFAAMASKARGLGQTLVERERSLDRQFADRTITPEALSRSLEEIGALQAKVRGAHLEAHLAQVAILTPEQNAMYARLRGYASTDEHAGHGAHMH